MHFCLVWVFDIYCNGCEESLLYMYLSIAVILLNFYGSYCLDDSSFGSSLSWIGFHIDSSVRYMYCTSEVVNFVAAF